MKRRSYLSLSAMFFLVATFNWLPGRKVDSLQLMTYNALFSSLDLSAAADVLSSVDADVIALQEIGSIRLQRLAQQLGYYAYSIPSTATNLGKEDTGILSRYPLEKRLAEGGVLLRLSYNQVFALWNIHLNPYPYQPYNIRDGKLTSEEEIIEEAATARLDQLKKLAPELLSLQEKGIPIAVLGDFNEPSHLDWTQDAARNGLHFGKSVNFPASSYLEQLGFKDLYRQLFPDECLFPGTTWGSSQKKNEVFDRIDFVYLSAENWKAGKAQIVGASGSNADIQLRNYPSDHRALSVTLRNRVLQ
jgi:exodeoxyribonuclease-3